MIFIIYFYYYLTKDRTLFVHQLSIHSFFLKESLLLKLGDPCLGTVFRQIILVVLVTHESNKLSIDLGLGFLVVISFSGSESINFASFLNKFVIKFSSPM